MSLGTPVALVENASLPGRRAVVGTLAELPALALKAGGGPTTVLFGEVLKDAAVAEEIEGLLRRA